MELGPLLAEGRTAKIYAWREGWVLKIFRPWFPEGSIHYEVRIAWAVCAAGVIAPQVGDLVEVNGRLGLEYERLNGQTMGEVMAQKPWLFLRYARQLAELHSAIHAIDGVKGTPTYHDRLTYKIKSAKGLLKASQEATLSALAQMPRGKQLCHDDFHPWNVMLTDKGPCTIDWESASSGSPFADVARTAILLDGVRKMTGQVTWIERLLIGWYGRVYLKRYFELNPGGETEYRRWRPIMAAARMSEDIPGLTSWLQQQVEHDFAR